MVAKKVLLKFIGKEGYDYKFEQLENNSEEIVLKIWKEKPFKDSIAIGEVGYAVYNENWINEWQKVQDGEEPAPKVEDKVNTVPKSSYSNEGAREGGLMHDAVALTIAEFKASKDSTIDSARISEWYEELKKIIKS